MVCCASEKDQEEGPFVSGLAEGAKALRIAGYLAPGWEALLLDVTSAGKAYRLHSLYMEAKK